jgi:recombination protein RecT
MSKALAVTSGKELAEYLDGLPPVRRVEESLGVLRDKLKLILPQHVSVDAFIRMTIVSVGRNPYLAENIPSLLQAVATAAVLGLDPVSDTGQGHLVKYGGAVKFVPGYQGLIDVATRDGRCTNVEARIVFEDDEEFALYYGTNSRIVHRPSFPDLDDAERQVRGAYSVFYFRDGRPQFEWCSRGYLERLAREALKKAGGKESKTQWSDPWNRLEMMRKSAIRRGSKFIRKSRELNLALHLHDQDERGAVATFDGVDPEHAALLERIADAADAPARPPARGTVSRTEEVASKLTALPEPAAVVTVPEVAVEPAERVDRLEPGAIEDRLARGVLLCVDCETEFPKDDGHDCPATGESSVGQAVGRELVALAYEAADRNDESGPALVDAICEQYGVSSLANLDAGQAAKVREELRRAPQTEASEPVGEAVASHLARLALDAAGGDQRTMSDVIVAICKAHGVTTMAGLDKESAERVSRELEAAVAARREREAREAPKPNPANEPIGEEGAAALVGDLVKILEETTIAPAVVLERACKQVGAATLGDLKPSQANRARTEAKKMATAAAKRAKAKAGGEVAPGSDGARITSALCDEIDRAFNDSGLPDEQWDSIVRAMCGRSAALNSLTNAEGRAVLAEIRKRAGAAEPAPLPPEAERLGPSSIGKHEASRLFTLLLNVLGDGAGAKDEAERVCARFGVDRLEDLDPNDASRFEKELVARADRSRMRPR